VLLTSGVLAFDHYSGAPAEAKDCAIHAQPLPDTPALRRVADGYPRWLDQQRGTVNDASCLNRTPVYGVVRPRSAGEVRRTLAFARAHDLTVAVAGTRHSMGGQSAYPGAISLDMRHLDAIVVDENARTVRVGAGATWRQVLEAVHPHGLSVAAMPSIDVLNVGGTLSANAHGADFRTGSLASTVRSLDLMLADGSVHTVDRTHEPELFRAAIGGYGLVGVILSADLQLVDSEMYDLHQQVVPTEDLAAVYDAELVPDHEVRMMYAHLSTSPDWLLEQAILYTYRRTDGWTQPMPPLEEEQDSRVARLVLNAARYGGLGQRVKWAAERHLLPRVRSCHRPRNEALRDAEACLVPRNQAMYNDLGLLRNRLTDHTDILQEYFLPHDQLAPFIAEAREALRGHDAVLLSASVRSVHDSDVMLDYAQGERLSVVFYLSQKVTQDANRDMADLTRTLTARALDRGGTFYLPYQQHYTRDDLVRAYPMVDAFFDLKRRVDPDMRFMNSFYRRYATRTSPVAASVLGA
jgi:FAD/FMN-containing dehydrogenase